MKEPVILRAHDYKMYEGNSLRWLIVIGVFGYSLLILFYFLLGGFHFSSFVQPFLLLVFMYYYVPATRNKRLIITEEGIEHENGYPRFLKNFAPSWKIRWDDIQYATLKTNMLYNVAQTPLLIKLQDKTLHILPVRWVDPNDKSKRINPNNWFSALFHSKKLAKQVITDSPLVLAFKQRGLLKDNEDFSDEDAAWSDLTANPITIAMMSFMVLSIFYFVFEIVSYGERYVSGGIPFSLIGLSGIVIAVLAYFLLRNIKMKLYERQILSVLVGLAASLVSSQLLLRVNAWTDSEGLVKASYTLLDKTNLEYHWKAKNMQLPELKFEGSNAEKYWNQYSPGDVKEFELRKGGLGFYQLSLTPIELEQRAFYH